MVAGIDVATSDLKLDDVLPVSMAPTDPVDFPPPLLSVKMEQLCKGS